MRYVEFSYASDDTYAAFQELEERYISSESALPAAETHELIDRGVRAVGDLPEGQPVIIPFGDANHLWYKAFPESWRDKPHCLRADSVPEEVALIESGLERLRGEVAAQLDAAYPEHEFVIVGLMKTRRVGFAHGGLLAKRPIDYDWNFDAEPQAAKVDRLRALDHLYAQPDRSPHIAYNIEAIDPTSKAHEGIQIQRQLPITTLHELLEDTGHRPPFAQAVTYVQQALDGLDFLTRHNLRLTDICLENIGIDTQRDSALWFDFDGLRRVDDSMDGYTARRDYWPPERRPKPAGGDIFDQLIGGSGGAPDRAFGTVEESEMAFEMGVNLRRIAEYYQVSDPSFLALVDSYTQEDPLQRPALSELQLSLSQFVQ